MSRRDPADWYSYQANKLLPKPAYKRPMPKFVHRQESETGPIIVEESFMDTVKMKALNFLKR